MVLNKMFSHWHVYQLVANDAKGQMMQTMQMMQMMQMKQR
jgi:hypothetical protein